MAVTVYELHYTFFTK